MNSYKAKKAKTYFVIILWLMTYYFIAIANVRFHPYAYDIILYCNIIGISCIPIASTFILLPFKVTPRT